jgi:hypothetical protein
LLHYGEVMTGRLTGVHDILLARALLSRRPPWSWTCLAPLWHGHSNRSTQVIVERSHRSCQLRHGIRRHLRHHHRRCFFQFSHMCVGASFVCSVMKLHSVLLLEFRDWCMTWPFSYSFPLFASNLFSGHSSFIVCFAQLTLEILANSNLTHSAELWVIRLRIGRRF